MVRYGMVEVCGGWLAAEASRSSMCARHLHHAFETCITRPCKCRYIPHHTLARLGGAGRTQTQTHQSHCIRKPPRHACAIVQAAHISYYYAVVSHTNVP